MSTGLLLLGLLAWGVLVVAMMIKLVLWIPSDLSAQPAGTATPATTAVPPGRSVPAFDHGGSYSQGGGGPLSIVPGPSMTGDVPGASHHHGRCVNAGPSTDGPIGVSGAGGFGGSSRGVDVGAPPTEHRALPRGPGRRSSADLIGAPVHPTPAHK